MMLMWLGMQVPTLWQITCHSLRYWYLVIYGLRNTLRQNRWIKIFLNAWVPQVYSTALFLSKMVVRLNRNVYRIQALISTKVYIVFWRTPLIKNKKILFEIWITIKICLSPSAFATRISSVRWFKGGHHMVFSAIREGSVISNRV